MIRRLRFLCLGLIAALAMSSVLASVSLGDVLTAEKAPVAVAGAQEGLDAISVHGGSIKCSSVNYTGTVTTVASSVSLTPTFSGCTFAGLAATIHVNGCSFLVTINPNAGNTTSTLDVVCPTGNEITATAPSVGTAKCILHLPAQQNLGTASQVNIGAGTTREITVTLNLTGVKYSQTAGTAETGNCATADNTTTGTYTGTEIFTGSTGGTHVGIFLS